MQYRQDVQSLERFLQNLACTLVGRTSAPSRYHDMPTCKNVGLRLPLSGESP